LKPRDPDRRKSVQFIAGWFAFAFALFGMSVLMGGAGHGWSSGVYSAGGMVVIPLFGAAFVKRGRKRAVLFAAIAFVGMLLIDYTILNASIAEGRGYFKKTLPLSAVWLVLWVGWQLGVIGLLAVESRRIICNYKR
jgi:hypothetical protein